MAAQVTGTSVIQLLASFLLLLTLGLGMFLGAGRIYIPGLVLTLAFRLIILALTRAMQNW
jgi:hypothetical protein